MKIPDPDRDQLLQELLESERGACGPTAEQVLQLIREDCAQRSQRRGLAMAAAVITAISTLATVHLRHPQAAKVAAIPPVPPAMVQVAETADAPASFVIEKVDDAGLLEMLNGQPVALASLPNGERRLMMIVQARRLAVATGRR